MDAYDFAKAHAKRHGFRSHLGAAAKYITVRRKDDSPLGYGVLPNLGVVDAIVSKPVAYHLRNPATGQFVSAYYTLPRHGLYSDFSAARDGVEGPRKTFSNLATARRVKTQLEKKFGKPFEIVPVAATPL